MFVCGLFAQVLVFESGKDVYESRKFSPGLSHCGVVVTCFCRIYKITLHCIKSRVVHQLVYHCQIEGRQRSGTQSFIMRLTGSQWKVLNNH